MSDSDRSRRPARRNLPAETTSFVGRKRELTEIRRLLQSTRMLTLAGPGGVGKTRLALRAADQLRRAFPDGAWLVELAESSLPEFLPQTVASGLRLRTGAVEPIQQLVDFLEDRRLLLVLDNCEHLVDACAALVDKLLAASPGLRVLATSRQRLRIGGEVVFQVDPLGWGEHTASEAVTLFIDRAAAVVPGFEFTAADRPTVASICRRLDGLPLAIELAAVWLRTLSLDQIEHELDHRFSLLVAGDRAAQPRQQRLTALMDWSFGLCSEAERLLWRRLSVFRGFDLAAVRQVCSGDGIDGDSVLPLLANLVEKSVLIREDGGHGGTARHCMLETVRAYGEGGLSATRELAQWQSRHLDYYAELARAFSAERFTKSQQDWVIRLQREHANLRIALDFSLAEPGSADRGLEMATSLGNYWLVGGHLTEGFSWIRRALAASDGPVEQKAAALRTCGLLAAVLDSPADLAWTAAELQRLADRVDNVRVRVDSRHVRAMETAANGNLDRACSLLDDVVARRQELGDMAGAMDALVHLATLETITGSPRAEQLVADLLTLAQRHGAQYETANGLWLAGLLSCHDGEYERAVAFEKESLPLRLPTDDFSGLASALDVLSWCAAATGEYERAAYLKGASDTLYRRSGVRVGETFGGESRRQAFATARAELSDEEFTSALREGAGWSVEQAFAYATKGARPRQVARQSAHAENATRLTARERQIAVLVADGLTNKEIGTRLVISRRTAESHVEHILTKLGFTSRAQIAAWIAEQ